MEQRGSNHPGSHWDTSGCRKRCESENCDSDGDRHDHHDDIEFDALMMENLFV